MTRQRLTSAQDNDLLERAKGFDVRKPKVKLTGTDGNAFVILGTLRRAARKAGWADERWAAARAEMMSGDYNHLLATAMRYFDVS